MRYPARLGDLDARDAARALVISIPRPVTALLLVRNLAVRALGLMPARDVSRLPERMTLEPGSRLGFFDVLAAGRDEVVLGEDDRHLDYRFLVRVIRDRRTLSAETTVAFHGWLGRLYFLPVRPFHALIVPILLRASLRELARTVPGPR